MKPRITGVKVRHVQRPQFYWGVLFALASALFPALGHAFSKVITTHYHPVVVTFFRCSISLLLLTSWVAVAKRWDVLKTDKLRTHILRSVLGTFSVMLIVYSYAHLPVGDIAALMNTSPLISVLLALLFLGESIDKRKIVVLGAGFAGAILMVQPSGQIPFHGVLMGLGASAFIAVITVLIRHLGRTEHPITTTFYFSLVGTIVTGIMVPFFWTGWSWRFAGLVALVGIFGVSAQLARAQALKLLPVAIKETLGYTFFLWSLLLGFLIWHTWPTHIVLIGSAIVIGSNLFLIYSESRKHGSRVVEGETVPDAPLQ